jgi:hypothetical protein
VNNNIDNIGKESDCDHVSGSDNHNNSYNYGLFDNDKNRTTSFSYTSSSDSSSSDSSCSGGSCCGGSRSSSSSITAYASCAYQLEL